MIEVELPDGRIVEFPATMTPQQIEAAIAKMSANDMSPDAPVKPQPKRGRFSEAVRQAGKAFDYVVGERVGLDPSTFGAAERLFGGDPAAKRGGLPRAEATAVDLGAKLLESGAGGLAAATAFGGELLGGPKLRKDLLAMMLETPQPAAAGMNIAPRLASRAATVRGADDVIKSGERAGVPVMTTDVMPPKTAMGSMARQAVEKIPFVGTGEVRKAQQKSRVGAVEDLIAEFDVGFDTPLERQIIAGLSDTQKANQRRAIDIRNDAVSTLNQFGEVPTISARSEIAEQIAKEQRLGSRANPQLVNLLKNTDEALAGDFELIKDIRTRVIQDIKKLQRGEHEVLSSQDEAALQAVKSAIDKDLLEFARKADPEAAKKWQTSNKLFADEFTKFKNSELKRLLAKGDVTPEAIAPVLRGGKVSELTRLAENAGPQGRAAARSSLIRDALQRSGWPREINPDRFATELSRPNAQKAINVFFKGEEKERLEGLKVLLEATRRAQQAAAAPPTGQQLITYGLGGATYMAPMETLLFGGTAAATGRAFESKPVRNLLLQIARTPKDSRTGQELLATRAAQLSDIITAERAKLAAERNEQ